MGNLSGEAKAPEALLTDQLNLSAFSSVSVGTRYPVGHGLFTPFTPCHKFAFCGDLQSKGEFGAVMKFAFPGVSEELNVAVVTDVRH